ncbi:MAG TPA: DUF3300 domain-containing protein [Myxococcales bacterium]|nr:DUF3300 domain-containing protein [Myxococcales bacterium]
MPPRAVQGEAVVDQTPDQIDQLVAPIALYPDALVAQILAASTYPTEIVEANRWMQQHTSLQGQELAQAVDQQSWDPSVKALTQFPSVLANLDKNLSWASSLGDAYVNEQQAVLEAVQRMRERARQAGNLKSTPQQTVTTQGSTIVIEPANPEVVYLPTYDPWIVYGPALVPYPAWYWYPGLYAVGPGIGFGFGFGIGIFAGFGWGWHHWGADWHQHRVDFDHHAWASHSRTFFDRNHFYRGGPGFRGGPTFHAGSPGFHAPGPAHFAPGSHLSPGVRSGAFSGFGHGGETRGFASRGASSAGSHFGGGFHAGGFHGGGHR